MFDNCFECFLPLLISPELLSICELWLDIHDLLLDLLLLEELAYAIVGHLEVVERAIELLYSLHEREMSIPFE